MLNKTGKQSEETKVMTVGETKITEASVADPADDKVAGKTFPRSVLLFLGAAALALAVVVVFGVHSRTMAASRLVEATDQAAIPTVNLVHPQPATRAQDLVLPGNTQPLSTLQSLREPTVISNAGMSISGPASEKVNCWRKSRPPNSTSNCGSRRLS
jgi:hypothetical protein